MRVLIPNLVPATTYYLEFKGHGPNDTSSAWSPRFLLGTDAYIKIPKTPTNLAVANVGTAFNITWDRVSQNVSDELIQVVSYDIEVQGHILTEYTSEPQSSSTPITHVLTLEENTILFAGHPEGSITVRVRAVDNLGLRSAWTSPVAGSNPPPDPPTVDTPVAGQSTISLSWTAPTGANNADITEYNVYVGTTGTFTPDSTNLVFNGNATTFTYVTSNYSPFYFKVSSVDAFGQESAFATVGPVSAINPFIVDTTAPGVPTITSATITNNVTGIGAVGVVSWSLSSPPTDLAGFVLRYRAHGSTDAWVERNFSDDTFSGSVELAQAFTNYDFQVRSYDFTANYSLWSSVTNATSPANTNPSNVTGLISFPTWDSITYQWNATSDQDLRNYEVTFSVSPTFAAGTNTTFLTGSSTTLTVSGLTPSTLYYTRVRAIDVTGATSAAWSATNTSTTQFQTGTISASGPITLGPSANLILNGGYIKSNTYTGTTQATNPSNAGFYLGNDGIRIDQGIIRAEALIGGTFTGGNFVVGSGGSIKSSNYSAGTAGWSLGNTGLEINSGSIAANLLLIQNGQNIFPSRYADFEWESSMYNSILTVSPGVFTLDTSNKRIGTQSLKVTTTGSNGVIYLAANTTVYDCVLTESSSSYIVSWYAMIPTSAATATVTPSLKNSTPLSVAGTGVSIPANNAWNRYSTVITTTSDTNWNNMAGFFFTVSTGTTIYLDGLQIEKQTSASTTPSNWRMPGITSIDGGAIRTGSIQSTSFTGIGSTPLWSIPMNGSATFQNLKVRGVSVVGDSGDGTSSLLASYNYVNGASGWKIDAAGNSEFNNILARGTFTSRGLAQSRIVIEENTGYAVGATVGMIEFYLGISGEIPSQIYVANSTSNGGPNMYLMSGLTSTYVKNSSISMTSGSNAAFDMSSIFMGAGLVSLTGSDGTFNGGVRISAPNGGGGIQMTSNSASLVISSANFFTGSVNINGALGTTGTINGMTFPFHMAGNVVTNTNAFGQVYVPFSSTFTSTPVVTATGGNGEVVAIYANNVTTSGFIALVYLPSFVSSGYQLILTSATVRINYVAVLPR